jgi:hypothetical protein
MAKKLPCMAVFAVVSVLTFIGCNLFNAPLKDFIKDATSNATSLDYEFFTDYELMKNGIIAIAPDGTTMIEIPLRNPQQYDLELTLKYPDGSDYEGSGGEVGVWLNDDKQKGMIIFYNPVYGYTFDLMLHIEANGRPMAPLKLPKMESRYLDANLQSLGLNYSSGTDSLIEYPFDFDPFVTEYDVSLPPEATSISLIWSSSDLPPKSSVKINNDADPTVMLKPGMNTVTITVTADCGRVKTYTLNVNVDIEKWVP